MKRFETEIFADRCATFFGSPRLVRDATIDAGLQSVHSDAYALGKHIALGLRKIAIDVLKDPADQEDFFEAVRDHIRG